MTAEANPPSYRVRWIQSVLFIALWMALGWYFHLSANAYLVLGVPLVCGFQLLVRRQSLVTLWVRREEKFRLGRAGWIFSLLFAVTPAWDLYRRAGTAPAAVILWLLAAIAGAFGAGFALEKMSRRDGYALLTGLCTAGGVGIGFTVLAYLARVPNANTPNLVIGLHSLLQYIPVSFLIEEVAFRGMLDSHLHYPDDREPGWSAALLSCAWGLWHLPIIPAGNTPISTQLAGLLFVHGVIGSFLSTTWRASGNLFTTAFIHALNDAVRNALKFH